MAGIEDRPAATAVVTVEDLHPDLLTRALRRLDGAALAAACCVTAHLRYLSTQPDLWRDLCFNTWPSLRLLPTFPFPHRSFFADAYPYPFSLPTPATDDDAIYPPTKLISAVDLYRNGAPILSRIVETDASTAWFRGAPFRVDALDRKDPLAPMAISPEEMTLSWVVIDPDGRRAVNVSSRRAVSVERHWYTGETLVRFPTVAGGCALVAVVACGEAGHVREISLTVEDIDGMYLNGMDSLVVLKRAMEAGRTVREGEAEAARRYADHVRQRRWRKQRRMRREGMLDLCCSAVGVAVFLAFLTLLAFR